MGNRFSSFASPSNSKNSNHGLENGSQNLSTSPVGDLSLVLRDFDLSKPKVAVIGAGITGVHIAYELGKLGFKVTVFDANRDIADGDETKFSLPFVGVGLSEGPLLRDMCMRKELARGLLSPWSTPSIISTDHILHGILSSYIHRWLFARRFMTFTPEQVYESTNRLSQVTIDTIDNLVKEHATLRPFVTRLSSSYSPFYLYRKGVVESLSSPSSLNPLMIDTIGWTRALAKIAKEKYDVEFALGERVQTLDVQLKYDTELLTSIRTEKNVAVPTDKADGTVQIKKVSSFYPFDAAVVAAGWQSSELTWNSAKLPIIGLRGFNLTIGKESNVAAGMRELLSPFTKDSTALVSLSQYVPLFLSELKEEYRLQGLLSFDTVELENTPIRNTIKRLKRALRQAGVSDTSVLDAGATVLTSSSDAKNTMERNTSIGLIPYMRSYTPDAVPIIDWCGGAFNVLVCAGFGDHAADFAPGASRIVAKLLEYQASILMENDQTEMLQKGRLRAPLVPNIAARTEQLKHDLETLCCGFSNTNPYSTDRFKGLVSKKVDCTTVHKSAFRRFTELEASFVRYLEPIRHAFYQQAISYASQDDASDFVKTWVYAFLYDAEDDLAANKTRKVYNEKLNAIVNQYEKKTKIME